MRSQDPELRQEIYDYVNSYKLKYGSSPSLSTIAVRIGYTKTTVMRYLKRMNEEGILDYDGYNIETKEANFRNNRLSSAAIVGSIPCGEAENMEEYIEAYVNLPARIFGSGELYILKANGDSMEDAGISDGDMVVISKEYDCRKGDIIVALDENHQNTLKRFGGKNGKGQAILEYMNEEVYPGKKILVNELVIQGIAKNVIKSL